MIRLRPRETRRPRLRLSAPIVESANYAFGRFVAESIYGLSPKGSWENTRDELQRQIEQSDKLGGPVVPYGEDPDNYDAIRPGDISISASYPDRSEVLVANWRTGDYFMVPYTIDENGNVTIGEPKAAELEVAAKTKEALRKMRESGVRGARGFSVRLPGHIREAKNSADPDAVEVMAIRLGPGNPVDKNWYDKGFIESIVPLLNAAHSHRDHPTLWDDKNIPERSVDTLSGWFSDAREGTFTDPEHPERGEVAAAFAMFHPVVGDDRTRNLLRTWREKLKTYPDKEPFVAFSINAYGVGAPGDIDGDQYNIVSLCTELRSVDMVTQAGAAGRPILQESRRMKNRPGQKNGSTKTQESNTIDPNLPVRTAKQREADKDAFLNETRRNVVRDMWATEGGKKAIEVLGFKATEAGGMLSKDDMDKAADKLGLVKGGKLHAAMEDALVDDDQDPDEGEPPAPGSKTATEGEEDLTPEKIDAMTDDQRKDALKKLAGVESAGGKKTPREILLEKRLEKVEAEVATAREAKKVDDFKAVVAKACEALKMPEPHRVLVERACIGASSNAEIAEIVQAYYDANVVEARTSRGAIGGGRARESARSVTAPNFLKSSRR